MESMQNKVGKSSPRLIDYLVIVGCKHPSRNGHSTVQPELLRTYPTIMHSDFSLPNDVVFFCQPEGCYSMLSPSLPSESGSSSSQRPLKSEFFTFSLTDKESNATRFGLCLNFLRPIPRRKRTSLNRRKSRHLLPRESGSRLASTSNEHSDSTKKHSVSDTSSSSDSEDSSSLLERPDRPYTHTLTSLCIVSHYQFCRKFEQCLLFLYNLIQKLHESCRPRFAGRQTVWSAITGGTPNISHPAVKKSIDEIDTWILRLLSTPSPVAGRTCVKVFLEPPEFGEPVIFALPDKNRFSLVDFPLQLPLKLLGPQKFLKVLFALLLEQKVLLQSSHCSRLTTCVMSLTALLYPLQYLFAAIPLLPSSLYGAEQLLQAPSPYVIGLPRSFLGSRFSFRLPRDVLLVDLDTQELYGTSAQEAIPKMPLTEEKFLIENLNKILQRAEAMDALDGDPELEDSKLQAEDPPEFSEGFDPLSYNADQDSINVALRVAMVLFFRSPNILGGLTEYTRTVRMYPRPVVAFQYERFMKSRLEPSPFTIILAKTQAVEYFAEWSLLPENEVYRRIESGVYAVSEISDRDRWFSDQLQTVEFSLWTEKFENGILRPALELIHVASGSAHSSKSKERQTVVGEVTSSSPHLMSDQRGVAASSTSGIGEMAACSASELSTDLSGSLGDSQADTDTSLTSNDNVNGETIRSGEKTSSPNIIDSAFEKPAFWKVNSVSSTEDYEDLQAGQPLPARLRDYYTPPTAHVIPEPPPETASSRHLVSPLSSQGDVLNSDLERETVRSANIARNELEETSRRSFADKRANSPTIARPAVRASFRQSLPTSNTNLSDFSSRSVSPSLLRPMSPASRAASRPPRRREGSPTQQKHSRSSGAMANLGAIISSWFIDASKMHEDLMDPEVRNHRLEIARAENQRFITESINAIRKGNLPGVFSRRRLQKLLEEEIYRNMALALAFDNFTSLLQGQDEEEGAVEEVCFSSWDHFKSFLWLFNHIAIGLQASSKPIGSTFIDSRGDIISPVGLASAYSGLFSSQSERERLTRGGISSGFLLLESAHTHYHLLPTRNSGIDNSLKSSGNVTISMPATPFNAKSRLWGTSEKPSPASGTDELGMPKSSPASTPLPESEVSGGESNDGQNTSGQRTAGANHTDFKTAEWRVWSRAPSLRLQSRDLPDLVELSQKLQARLSEVFKNTHSGPISERVHLSRATIHRLSQRSSFNVRRGYHYRSRNPRSICSLQTSPASHSPIEGFEYLGECNMYALAAVRATPYGFSSTPSPSLPLKRTQTRKSVVGGEVGGPDLSTPKNNLSTPSPPIDLHQTAPLGTPDGISMKMVEDIVLFPPFKSSRSLGFRYYKGRLLQTAAEPKNVMDKIPPHVSVPALRSNISGIYGAKSFGENNPDATVKAASSSLSASVERPTSASVVTNVEASTKSPKSSVGWTYLFEEALLNSTDSKLWTNMQFWEDMFLDTVTQEREILGLDFGPADLLQHYSDLDAVDRKRLELQEDCLLANTLHNLIAFMVMARVSLEQIRRKARRILAKSHTGLHYTQKISKLLDCLECLRGNDIDLVPPLSRQLIHDVYLVGSVWQNTIEMTYLEIYSEFLILRYPEGPLIRRWWFDQIINFTHPPNSDMVCLQTVVRGKRAHFTFKSETAHQLFRAIASAIKEAASKRQRGQLLTSLGAEVNAVDVDTNAAVVIRFTHMDFCLHYGDDFKTIPLEMIKRCYISADDIFSVEAFDPLNRLPFDGHFKTDLALVLLKQWERLIGVAVARRQAGILSGTVTPLTSRSSNNSVLGLEVGE